MTHRGPDDAGVYVGEGIGLGHRRLSIVDLEGGYQPMRLAERPLHIVYNGEVYNHPELTAWLSGRGHRYRTRCDTESVLRCYAEEGPAGVERLRGMFAFGVWDEAEGALFLARDRLGIKPLYYVHDGEGSLFFASEIKALLEAGAVRPELNYEALPDYLANHAPSGDRTLFQGVRRLLPGHTLTWKEGQIRIGRYWELRPCAPAPDVSDEALIDEFRERLDASIRERLMADVPLGVFLSGGIDSAAIATTMADMVDEPIKTFSVGFEEREANEFRYARMVSDRIGSEHHEIVVSRQEFFDAIFRLTWHEDEPLAHIASVPLHYVSTLAAEHAKVVLTGEGSDELLGGYARYWKTGVNLSLGGAYRRLLPSRVTAGIERVFSALPTWGPLGKVERTFLMRAPDIENLYLDNFAVFDRGTQDGLLSDAAVEKMEDVNPYRELKPLFQTAQKCPLLNQLLFVDLQTYLQELLMKQDQMSMSASLESRVPFLDHRLVEFGMALPDGMKRRRWKTKYILRKAIEDRVPREILARKKMGFPVPFGRWIREGKAPFVEQVLMDGRLEKRDLFQDGAVARIVREHKAGSRDHGARLWSLFALEAWFRVFFDGERSPLSQVGAHERELV